ncbi:MAG: metallophosphoesterase [Prevotella sp.]|nr:metallophosphoesterase [Prevotella sp.]
MIRRLLIVLAAFVTIAANSQTATEWKECAKGNVRLIVANDLGRNGYYDQKPIASLMGEVADGMGPDAVLALGDIHHYGGVRSVSDPLWMTNYETVYTHPELLVDWFPICGNHEYRGNTQAMIDYSSVSRRWNMPARYYTRTFESKGTTVKVVFIDTTPLIDKYRNDAEQYPDACKEDMDKQLKWLDSVLSAAKEDWVLVAGHHPVYAETSKAEYERADMQRRVDAVLRRHKVDMYLCGHIHNFQHIRAKGSDIDYIVNSSASLSRKVKPVEGTQFCSGETGFSLVTADKKALNLYMINRDGKVLHTVTRNK